MGAIKSPERAMEKALWCYDGDVSRVTDICRCRILYDGLADLTEGLEAVLACGVAWVCSVKNSLRDDHDSWTTGGFRVRLCLSRPPVHTESSGCSCSTAG